MRRTLVAAAVYVLSCVSSCILVASVTICMLRSTIVSATICTLCKKWFTCFILLAPCKAVLQFMMITYKKLVNILLFFFKLTRAGRIFWLDYHLLSCYIYCGVCNLIIQRKNIC